MSRQVAELGKMHLSILQLLESVENLENKVDKNVPQLQREISKMEFNLGQATVSLSLVKEEQVRHLLYTNLNSPKKKKETNLQGKIIHL